jgi:hypothetical protein
VSLENGCVPWKLFPASTKVRLSAPFSGEAVSMEPEGCEGCQFFCRLFGAERRGGLGHCPGTSTFSEARSILVRTTPPNGPAAPSLAAQVEARPGAGARDRSSHCARLQEPVQTAYRNFNSKRVAAMPPNVTVCRTRETVSGNRHRLERMDFWTGPMLRRELSVGLELMMPPRQPSLPSCSRLSPPSF